jgi:FKBP-type peptidyl-prolyl cis-trans isomerase
MARVLRTSLLFLAVLFTGCLDDSPFVPEIEDTTFSPNLGVDLAASTKTSSGLYYRDLTVGAGAEVAADGNVAVTTVYSLYLRTGELIESGTFATTLGEGSTNRPIAGYEEGVRGMRVGGRRQLIIPPHLGYGGTRNGNIPANSILVFTVDLTSLN